MSEVHPWRANSRIDHGGVRRSTQFSRYLDTLPPDERKRIESAEREYVNRTRDPAGFHVSAQRDFSESMKGLRDEEREFG